MLRLSRRLALSTSTESNVTEEEWRGVEAGFGVEARFGVEAGLGVEVGLGVEAGLGVVAGFGVDVRLNSTGQGLLVEIGIAWKSKKTNG